MTSQESSTRKKSVFDRGSLGSIIVGDIKSMEFRKSRIREESIVIPEINDKAKRTLVRTVDPAAPWYFTHA